MIIRKSLKQYALYRYGGTSDGKNMEVRIGNVPLGTKPDSIPDDIVQDLTPRELNELKDVLVKDQRDLLDQKLSSVEDDMKEIAEAVKAGVLDGQSAAKLCVAAKALLKVLPKMRPQIDSVIDITTANATSGSTP